MDLLKKLLKDANITQGDVAKELNIKSLSTMSLKLNKKSEFTTGEALKLKNLINSKLHTNYTIEELFE